MDISDSNIHRPADTAGLLSPGRRAFRTVFLAAVAAIAIAAAAVSSCGVGREPTQTPVQGTLPSGHHVDEVLIARGDYYYPPFEFENERGEPDGFTVEILRTIAEVMDLDVHIDLGPWQEVRRQLEEEEIDIIVGMFRTEERDRLLDFTVPHIVGTYGLFARSDVPIEGLDDLSEYRITVQESDLGHDFLKKTGFSGDLTLTDDIRELLPAVADGRADATILAISRGLYELREKRIRNVRMIGEPLIQQPYCIAVSEGRPDLLATLNEGLAIIKANGSYERIYDRWFGIYENRMGIPPRVLRILYIAAGLLLCFLLAVWFWSSSLRRLVRRRTDQLREELEKQARTQEELRRALGQVSRERNRAEEADAAKTRFLASVSHELRTPLHGIMGMTELLARTPLDEEQEELRGIIDSSAHQLHRVLSDLLEVNRITAGSFAVRLSTFRLDRLDRWLRPLLERQARMRNLGFSMRTEGGALPIRTDMERIAQVIINLTDNAIKYTDYGSVHVSLRRIGDELIIETRDTGPGIPSEHHRRIFEPYFQVNAGQGGKNGLGLGLTVVRTVVERLGGTMGLESGPEGSVFRIVVPVEPREALLDDDGPLTGAGDTGSWADAAGGDSPEPPAAVPAELRILVAEDEAINRIYLVRLFADLGHVCEQADDGKTALERLTRERFDLALIDLSMPEMDGLEVSRACRAAGCTTPLIALTAHASETYRRRCIEAGMSGFVSKPFSEAELLREIARVVPSDPPAEPATGGGRSPRGGPAAAEPRGDGSRSDS